MLDAWNNTTQASVVAVFTTRKKAQPALERVMKRPGVWYAGVDEAATALAIKMVVLGR